MAERNRAPGVVLLGSDFKALGVIRSLGRHGVPSAVVDNVQRSAWFSRYVVQRHPWVGPMEGPEFLDFLLFLAAKPGLDQWILIPAQDEAVGFVAQYAAELHTHYRLVTPRWEVVRWALDKRLTHQMAREVGIPYPRTWYPASEDELTSLDIRYPVIVKPAFSIRLQYALRLKALPAQDAAQLREQYRVAVRVVDPDELMIQEIIPGHGATQYSVAAYFKNGQSLMSMTARRTRQYPIDYGLGSSYVEAIEVPELFEVAEKFLGHIGVSGMVEVEFKRDLRDNEFKLLDINVRPWGWHTLCIACGLDFPYIAYCDALGQPLTPAAPQYGHRWVRLLTDIPAGLQEARAGLTTPAAYLRSLAGKKVFSVLDWRDPLPALGDLGSALSRAIRLSLHRGGAA
jgi:D-aspartate ligase